ncbi:hypothetical protein EHI2019_000520600 [Entamoeba histolytica]
MRRNKFGEYVNSKIDKVSTGEWINGHIHGYINDSQSFVFSLKSNGRIKGMKKFNIKEPEYAFRFCNQSYGWLLVLDMVIFVVLKKMIKQIHFFHQRLFEYEGIRKALCGKEFHKWFTPKGIIAIEMK